jgi:hypothetical protein
MPEVKVDGRVWNGFRATMCTASMFVAALSLTPHIAHAQLTTTAEQLQQWGEAALAVTDSQLWMADSNLYAERLPRRGRGELQPAYMWGCGVQLVALAAGTRVAPDAHRERLVDYIEQLNGYWKTADDIAGYDVQPGASEPDRYYDDNAWIVLGLVEAFELTGDEKYLDRADETMKYVLSGEDEQLGGGIYWREREKRSKNTCSNAPAVAGLLRLYSHRKRDDLLASARRIHEWTVKNLQDDDGLMLDNVRLDGRVDRRKFSYNTALAIRSCVLFHELTGEPQWLPEAQRMARAAEAHWVDPETGGIRDGGQFAHMLLEAFLAVHAADYDSHWLEVVDRALAHLHAEVRTAENWYVGRWDGGGGGGGGGRRRGLTLLDQASATRAFFVAADAWRRNATPTPPAETLPTDAGDTTSP